MQRGAVEDEFEAMYRRELVPLTALGLTLTGNREVTADLVHEAMLRGYRDWSSVRRLDRPGAWVRRVLINLVIDQHRRAEREWRAVERLAGEVDRGRSECLVEVTDHSFWGAVRALPERERVAVALHYLEDMPIDEIAAVMQIAVGTVKSSLFRARRTLAAVLCVEEVSDGRA